MNDVLIYAEALNWAKPTGAGTEHCLFGLRSDDLNGDKPYDPNDYSGSRISAWAQQCPGAGFQFQHDVTSGPGDDVTDLDLLLDNAYNQGGKFIEVWTSNATDPTLGGNCSLGMKKKYIEYKPDFL